MALLNLAQKDIGIYLVIVNRLCPDCGGIHPHRIYEQLYPALHRVTIQEDCLDCGNTRAVAKIQDGNNS